ncbi:EpsG family protein [Limosilactobacillus reuteri subsp. suis]|uniref:EpsG family protein n=1 Tax=Limosilactobacillus reuteri TaxID=1598 RepID=UPI003994663B
MLKFIFYLIWFTNIILVIAKKRSKIISFFSFIISFVMFAGNNSNPDYVVYQWAYDQHNIEGFEPGFKFLVSIFQSLSLNYQEMLMVIQMISLIMIWICIRNVTPNINAFWAIYFFAQQFIDIIQWRNYIASVFLLCAIILLYRDKRVLSLLFTIFASSFHITFSIFVVFVLFDIIRKDSSKARIKNSYIIVIGAIIVIYAIGYVINMFSGNGISSTMITQILGMDARYQSYSGSTRFGSIIPFIVYIFDTYTILWICKSKLQLDKKLTTIIVNLNLFVGLFTPLLLIDINFYRIFRDVNILNFVFLAYVLDKNKVIDKTYIEQITMFLLMGSLWKIMTILQGAIIFSSIYDNNLWLK